MFQVSGRRGEGSFPVKLTLNVNTWEFNFLTLSHKNSIRVYFTSKLLEVYCLHITYAELSQVFLLSPNLDFTKVFETYITQRVDGCLKDPDKLRPLEDDGTYKIPPEIEEDKPIISISKLGFATPAEPSLKEFWDQVAARPTDKKKDGKFGKDGEDGEDGKDKYSD